MCISYAIYMFISTKELAFLTKVIPPKILSFNRDFQSGFWWKGSRKRQS